MTQYPLITQKYADYILFKQGYDLVVNKEHLTTKGLERIIGLRASMNRGLSDKLNESFPNVVRDIRPLVVNQLIRNPQWLAGFASAEGCFYIGVNKSTTTKVNIQLEFQITQHVRDILLIQSFVEY